MNEWEIFNAFTPAMPAKKLEAAISFTIPQLNGVDQGLEPPKGVKISFANNNFHVVFAFKDKEIFFNLSPVEADQIYKDTRPFIQFAMEAARKEIDVKTKG